MQFTRNYVFPPTHFRFIFKSMMKILIVDDNAEVRRIVADYLPETVEEIYECADGADAFLVYEKYQPDWVLMDWQMKQTDGITAIRKIIAEFPEAKICMVTTFDSEELRQEAFAAGVCGFVLKRNLFELDSLLEVSPNDF